MTAVYSKPTSIPRWADTSLNVTEPSSGKKDEGWLVGEKGISSWENWRAKLVGSWFKWINERFADGATKDILRIYNPENAQKILELGQPAGVSQLFSGSGSPGPVRIWTNVDDGTQDDASFNVYYLLHKLYFESSKTGGGNEKEYFHLAPTGSNQLSSTRQAIKCAADLIDNGGSIGAAGDRWAKIYHDVPWLQAQSETVVNVNETGGAWQYIHQDLGMIADIFGENGSTNAAYMSDGSKVFPIKSLIGKTILNLTDGSSATITDNTEHIVYGTLSGGSDNEWDLNDLYQIVEANQSGFEYDGVFSAWKPTSKKGLYLLNWNFVVRQNSIDEGLQIRIRIQSDDLTKDTIQTWRGGSGTDPISSISFSHLIFLAAGSKIQIAAKAPQAGDDYDFLNSRLSAYLIRDEL